MKTVYNIEQIENCIRLVEEFYEKKGRLLKWKEKYKGIDLGSFLSKIRTGAIMITDNQLKRLEAIGFIKETREERKERKVALLEEFYEKYGRLPYQGERYHEVEVGTFVMNIKQGKTTLTDLQINRLKKIGFTFKVKDWEEERERKIQQIEAFYETYGRMPTYNEKIDGVIVGFFLHRIKTGIIIINDDQLKRLERIGFINETKEEMKERKVTQLEKFYQNNRRLPGFDGEKADIELETFMIKVKQGKIILTDGQMKRLQSIGCVLEKNCKMKKDDKISLIEEFYRKMKRLPEPGESYKGDAIGLFLNNIRQGLIKITEDQLERLYKIGFRLEIKDKEVTKEYKICLIEEFYEKNGRLPKVNELYKEVTIGNFLDSIKQGKIKITEGQLERLKRIGFLFSLNNRTFRQLEEFHERENRLPTPDEPLGEILLSVQIGEIRINQKQLIKLRQMGCAFMKGGPNIIKREKSLVK